MQYVTGVHRIALKASLKGRIEPLARRLDSDLLSSLSEDIDDQFARPQAPLGRPQPSFDSTK